MLGTVSNLTFNDGALTVFRSYSSGSDIKDYVDDNTSNVDSVTDKGAHSNFTALQYGPDSACDTLSEEDTSGEREVLNLYVNADDENKTDWTRAGANPYLDAIDYNTSYVYSSGNNMLVGDFDFADSGKSTETINNVTVQLYAKQSLVDNNLEVFVWNGSVWTSLGLQKTPSSWDWMNWTATTELDTWTKIDGTRIYIRSRVGSGTYEVDCARLQVEYISVNYELDLEVQWIAVDHDQENEELCIYPGILGNEGLSIDYWNGSSWIRLIMDLTANSWNNVSVSLTDATFTVRFKGGTETGDTTQDTWDIDSILLHVWSDQHVSVSPFDWVTILLYATPVIFGLLFLLVKFRGKKRTKPHIEERPDAFSEQFGMTHQQMVGEKMLLEIDPTSDYYRPLSSFVSDVKKCDELLFVVTNKNSTLHSTFSEEDNVRFLLLDSKTTSPHIAKEKETYLPSSDLSLLLHTCVGIQKIATAATGKTVNLLFDNLSDIILRCGFERAYKFTRLLLKEISSTKTRVLFLYSPSAHDHKISSSIRDLFHINLAYSKGERKVGTL